MDPNEQQSQGLDAGHPAWQEILSVLPDELHPLITPKLEEWDRGVQQKLQDSSKFEAYKPLVEHNVPLESIQQALWLAQQFEENPEEVVQKAIDAFNLERFKTPANSAEDDDDEDYEYDEDDPLAGLENHPAYAELKKKYDEVQGFLDQQRQTKEEEEASTELEQYLEEMHKEHGDFNDLFVTALLANGVQAEEAIQMYQSTIKTEAEKLAEALGQRPNTQPPVVMGGAGTAGSGVPEQPISFGSMRKGDVKDLVTQYLEQAARSE